MKIHPSPSSYFTKTFSLVLLSLLLSVLASCDLLPLATPEPVPLMPSGDESVPEALVTFYVEIPTDTPENEPILLSVLDEVTGLALNAKRYPMEKMDDYAPYSSPYRHHVDDQQNSLPYPVQSV